MNEKNNKAKKPAVSNCETCVWFDYDEFYGEDVCRADLDEDEMSDYITGHSGSCPMYRFYDEYKSVQKQN